MSFGGAGADVLDVLLKLSNLQGFVAGTREAAAGVRSIGTAAKTTSSQVGSASSKMGGLAGLASKAFKGTAVAAGVFAWQSVKMATTFQQQMEMIHTQAGDSQGAVNRLSKEILGMSSSGMYAQGPVELAKGLYHLESIGLRGTRALNALKAASQGAAVGNANLEDTASALGAAWLVNIKGGGNLHDVMATLNATVGQGNMRMNELVDSLGTGVLAAAKNAGISLQDTMGALATLTDEGYQGSSAMAQLATAFHFLTDPTTKAKKALQSIGLQQFELANTMRTKGLPAALRELNTHLSKVSPTKREAILGDILPAGRGRVLAVLMNQVDRYGNKVQQIDKTSKNFGEDIAATHRTAAFKIHAAWAQIQADMVRVGNLLKPVVVTLAQSFARLLTWLIKIAPTLAKIAPWLAPLAAGFVAYRLAVLGAAAANVIFGAAGTIMAFLQLATGVRSLKDAWLLLDLAMDANPIFLVVAAVIAIGVALFVAYKKVKWFRDAVNAVWHWMKGAAHDVAHAMVDAFNWFKNAVGNVVNFVRHHWRQLILLIGPLGLAIDFVTKHWQWFKNAANNVWNFVTGKVRWAWNNVIHPVFNWIGGAAEWLDKHVRKWFSDIGKAMYGPIKWAWEKVIHPVINWIVGAFRWAMNEVKKAWDRSPIAKLIHIGTSVSGSVGHFGKKLLSWAGVLQHGGTVTQGGMALVGEAGPELLNLPRGAQVQPLRTGGFAGAGAGAALGNVTIVVPVSIDGREVVRATGRYVENRLARQ